MGATPGTEEAGIISGLPNYSMNFYLNWCCSNFQQISQEHLIRFQKFQNYFKPNQKSSQTVGKLQPKLGKNIPH